MIALDILAQVRSDFDTCAKELTKEEPEFQRFILDHERKPLVLNSLSSQIYTLEQRFGRQNVMHERRKIVAGVTEMFVKAARIHKEQQNMSEIQRSQISPEEKAKQDMEGLLTEVPVVG